jgi:hypothetical protein
MGKLLDRAIEKMRELPEDQQDMAAAQLIGCLAAFFNAPHNGRTLQNPLTRSAYFAFTSLNGPVARWPV